MEQRLYPALIIDALRTVRYPGNGKDLVSNGMVEDDIRIDGNKVSFSLIFEKPTDPFIRSLVKQAEVAITTHIGDWVEIAGNVAVKTKKSNPEPPKMLPGVKNIIGVSSGKGGVGKSTVTALIATMAYYKLPLYDYDEISSFTAGDVHITKQDVQSRAEKAMQAEMNSCCDITDFGSVCFFGVRI